MVLWGDGQKKSGVACVVTPGRAGQPPQQTRTFGTMTADVVALIDGLAAAGCTHVAMESTGVYWKPLYTLLDGTLEVLVVNAAGRTKQTALGARYRALVARRGKKRGAVAVGHTLLLIAYHVLTRMTTAPASPWPAPISLSPTT